MLDDNTVIEVKNNINAVVAYSVPDMNNLVRTFPPKSMKKVTMEELRKLSYTTGGYQLLKNYLSIENKQAVEELLGEVEPEYFYTTDELKNLLLTGSLDQLEDFLNFAPEGLKDTIKDLAVSLEINDVHKRDMIKKFLDFDVTKALELLKEDEKDEIDLMPKTKKRKATPISENKEEETTAPKKPQRKYNVVK